MAAKKNPFAGLGGPLEAVLTGDLTKLTEGLGAITGVQLAPSLEEVSARVEVPKAVDLKVDMDSAKRKVSAPVLKGETLTAVNAAQGHIDILGAFPETLSEAQAAERAAALRAAAAPGNSAMDAVQILEHHKDVTLKEFAGQKAKLNTLIASGKLETEEVKAANAAIARITALEEAAAPTLKEAERAVSHYREAIPKGIAGAAETGAVGKLVEGVAAASAGKSSVVKNISAAAAKAGVIGSEARGAMSWYNPKTWLADAKANWNIASIEEKTGKMVANKGLTFGRTAMIGGTVVGSVIGLSGGKDLMQAAGVMGADLDDQGKEVPNDGKLWKGLAKVGGAAAVVVATVLSGGRAKSGANIAI